MGRGVGMRSLWRAVRGKTAVQPGDVVLAYEDRSTVMLWTVSLLGVLEVVVVHVLTARWPVVQWTLSAVGVLGMVAFLAWGLSLRQMPHVIRQGRLVLRSGRTHAVEVPLATLSAVRRHVVGEHPRILAVEGGRLVLSFTGDTNVELALDPPAEVQVTSGPVAVERVLFYANDPQDTVRTLRERATSAAG
jgi:hypothetical protein